MNTLANAIVIAMRMNDETNNQQSKTNVLDIANAVAKALQVDTERTNTLLPATSTMASLNDTNISAPLSPIYESFTVANNIQHNYNDVSFLSADQQQNKLKLLPLFATTNNNNINLVDENVTDSTPSLEWSLTSKGKDLLIVNNHTFKCNRTTATKRYWRCDEMQYCKSWVKTTLDGGFIGINNEEHDHVCDPDNILIKKIIGYIRTRCKQELTSLTTIYEEEIRKAKLSDAQLARMPRYDQIRKFLFLLSL